MVAAGCPSSARREHDGHVPNYNIFGQQHHRLPTIDKAHFAKIAKEKPEWSRTPRFNSASEMFSSRRAAKHPDLSYDIDGDGAVGATDYFIGKQFSCEHDNRLNTAERSNVVQALESGMLDNYSFGHDHFGAKRPYAVKQIRGKIISVDNVHELNEVYPPHWNAEKVPRFKTNTEMNQHRRAELINAADRLRSDWDKKFPDKANEPPVPREPSPSIKGMSKHVMRDKRRREAREYAGLDSQNSTVNPSREDQPGTSIEYVTNPTHASRSEMRAHRKSEMREELQRLRDEGESDYVPALARHTTLDSVEYDERRPDPNALTLSKLRHQRKADFIEHNMSNFKLQSAERPKFSEQKEAWWTLCEGYVPQPPPCNKMMDAHETGKDITAKVTSVCPPPRRADAEMLAVCLDDARPPTAQELAPFDQGQHRTLHRWSTEFVPVHADNLAPRHFDGVTQAPTYSMDTAELDQFSSFKCIAKNAINKSKLRQKKNAEADEERAHAWKFGIHGFPDDRGDEDFVESTQLEAVTTSISTGRDLSQTMPAPQQPNTAREPRAHSPKRGGPTVFRRADIHRRWKPGPPEAEPGGEDAPMTERLERITTGRKPLPTSDLDAFGPAASATTPRNSATANRIALAATSGGNSQLSGGATREEQKLRAKTQTRNSEDTFAFDSSQCLAVRTGGFQWIERIERQNHTTSLESVSSKASLFRLPQASLA